METCNIDVSLQKYTVRPIKNCLLFDSTLTHTSMATVALMIKINEKWSTVED